MKIKLFLFLPILIYSCKGNSQTRQTDDFKAIEAICKNADIIEVEKKLDYTEVEFICDKIAYEVGIDLQGNIIYKETPVTQQEIPYDKIIKKIEKKYPGYSIDEYSRVELSDTSFYKVELLKNGIEENAFFTSDGKWFRIKNFVSNEQWNSENLQDIEYYKQSNYNYLAPDKVIDLPETLREISGLAVVNNTTVFCVQDELGVVFALDILKEELTDMYRFTDVGDFEDVAVNGDTVFVLRSDGTIFNFNYKQFNGKIQQQIVQANSLNIEGLCINTTSKKLLMASKEIAIGKPENQRIVYSLHVNSAHNPTEFLTIDNSKIQDFITSHYSIISGNSVQCNPSAIAVHPITKETYILSATNRLISIYNNESLVSVYPLPANIYYKPEGIGFLSNGDMILCSEGMKNGYVGGQIFVIKSKNQSSKK